MVLRATLPAPPADLATRNLPLARVSGLLYRIHRTNHPWRHFGRNVSERFDDALGQFGVLYCSSRPESAFAEVFLRQLSLMVVAEADLRTRSLTSFTVPPLRCVDLTGTGLRKLSCDNRISTEKPSTMLWSRAIFTHPQQPDGILYRSRHNPRFRCLALFDRCGKRLSPGTTEMLMGTDLRTWTADQLKKYDLAMV